MIITEHSKNGNELNPKYLKPDNLTCSISAAKVSKFLLDKLIKFGIYSIPFAPLSFAKQTIWDKFAFYDAKMCTEWYLR